VTWGIVVVSCDTLLEIGIISVVTSLVSVFSPHAQKESKQQSESASKIPIVS